MQHKPGRPGGRDPLQAAGDGRGSGAQGLRGHPGPDGSLHLPVVGHLGEREPDEHGQVAPPLGAPDERESGRIPEARGQGFDHRLPHLGRPRAMSNACRGGGTGGRAGCLWPGRGPPRRRRTRPPRPPRSCSGRRPGWRRRSRCRRPHPPGAPGRWPPCWGPPPAPGASRRRPAPARRGPPDPPPGGCRPHRRRPRTPPRAGRASRRSPGSLAGRGCRRAGAGRPRHRPPPPGRVPGGGRCTNRRSEPTNRCRVTRSRRTLRAPRRAGASRSAEAAPRP